MSIFRVSISLMLLLAFAIEATAQVTINSVRVVEENYSLKVLAIEVEYDGSSGERVTVAALAATERETFSNLYTTSTIEQGTSTVTVDLMRPDTEDNDRVDSWGVQFRFRTLVGRRFFDITERISLTWPSLADYYDVENSPQEILASVDTIYVNEALDNTHKLIRWLAARSNHVDAMQIIHRYHPPPEPNLVETNTLHVSEDVSFEDLNRVLRQIQEFKVNITSLVFMPVTDPEFVSGMLAINRSGYMSIPEGRTLADFFRPFDEFVEYDSMEEFYRNGLLQPTPPEVYSSILLDRIIALNDQNSRRAGQQAQEMIENLLDHDPNQPRAYVELARSQFRTQECCDQEIAARNIMNIALNLFPDDPYVNHFSGYVEHTLGEYERALLLYQIAEQQREEEIIWLINNWANTLLSVGRTDEALEKFAKLMTFSNLNATDERAVFSGLVDYVEVLVANRSREAGVVYEKLISEYPERARCLPVDYAQYILFTESDIARARQTLGDAAQYSCNNHSAVEALVDIYAWFNGGQSGSRPVLYNAFLKHPQIDELIYRIAAGFEPVPLLQALDANGVDLDQTNARGGSALQQAISDSNIFAIKSLASGGANIHDDMGEGFTPLMFAIFMEDIDSTRALVEAGANPNIETELGMSAIDIAVQLGDQEIIDALGTDQANDV